MKKPAIEGQEEMPQIRAEPAWYCLRSLPKHEYIAAANLRMLEGVTVFCPRIRFKRATRRGLVWVTEGVFPCYLFARFDLAKMHRRVLYAHGVCGIVRFGDRYPTIEEESFAQLRTQIGVTEVKEVIYEFSQGDQVKITKGVFLGLQAVVTQVLSATQRVRILMDFLGRQTEAEVENASLLPQVAHPLAA
jgi:transcriptional antiterminator RfaH